jgi:flagellin
VSSVQSIPYAPPSNAANSNRAVGAEPARAAPQRTDQIQSSYRGEIGGAREALSGAGARLDLALAAGREAAKLVSQMRDFARAAATGDEATRAAASASFASLLDQYGKTVGAAIAGGASVLAGEAVSVSVDPDAPSVTVQGHDLRLKDQPGAEDVLRLSTKSHLNDPTAAADAARDAEASLARLDTALSRLSGACLRFASHDAFLATLDSAVAADVSTDLDAEGARLTALQVRQSLAGVNVAIANSAPSGLLALFRE